MSLEFPTKQSFALLIEKVVRDEKMTYIEAILHLCEEREIDPLDIGKLISPAIKSKVEAEAMRSNLLPKSNSISEFLG
jgi:hypothetical protein